MPFDNANQKPKKPDKRTLMRKEALKKDDEPKNQRKLDIELNKLESQIEELRVLYEQYFVDVFPQPPDKQRKEVVRFIRQLLKAPFKNSQIRFRLRTLVTRYQTYSTYWERVIKEREEGKYAKDLFKAEMREKLLEDIKKEQSAAGKADKGIRQLFTSYEEAMRKNGVKTDGLNFDTFKKSLLDKAKKLKEQHGVKKLQYKIVVKDGKVVVKASTK